MDRKEFQNKINQYKKAREENPQLSYWQWKMNLPDNLANTPDWEYNNIGAWSGGLQPTLEDDGYYHLGSRNPYTGEILKPKHHPTYQKAIESEIEAGYYPYEKNGVTYTKTYSPIGDLSGYADGTDGIRESEDRQYVIDWFNNRKKYNNPLVKRQLDQIYENSSINNYNNTVYDDAALNTYFKSKSVDTVPVTYQDVISGHNDYGGYYHPNEGVVIKKSSLNNKTFEPLIHEFSHVINSNILNNNIKNTINNIIYDQQIYDRGDFLNEYLTRPEEIHSRLMEFRKLNNLDPTKSVTMPQLKKLKKKGTDRDLFNLFPDDNVVLDLLNNVASVDNSNIIRAENGTDGIEDPVEELKATTRTTLTPQEQKQLMQNYAQYSRMSGSISPILDIKTAADFTPVGNVLMAKDIYDAASYNDYLTAGLLGAAMVVPPIISKTAKKFVPSFVTAAADKINALRNRERALKATRENIYQKAIEQRNRTIEDLYTNGAAWERAEAIKKAYGDDYPQAYRDIINQYENDYFNLPEPVVKNYGESKAAMSAKKDAIDRYQKTGQPAGYGDFEYQIDDTLEGLDYPTTVHELGHYVDFNLAKSANPDKNNSLLNRIKGDLSVEPNRLFPDKTSYFRTGSEQKSYMNTLRRFMLDNNMIINEGDKVSTRKIRKAIDALPSDMQYVKGAYEQFKDPKLYTKWFNKIPLLGTIPFIIDNDNDKSN